MFREDMVKKWQGIDESSGNPLGSQFFVPVGRGYYLRTITVTKSFHGQYKFLRYTKMKLVYNLGDTDEVLDIELNEHVDISYEYLTLHTILRSFKVKVNPVILSVENTYTLGTCCFFYEETMEKYMVDLLSNLDSHIKDIGDWEESAGNYIHNILEQVTPGDVMRNVENLDFLKKYAAKIDSGTTAPILCAYVNMNYPPQRRPRTFISYSAVVQKETSTKAAQQNQNMDATIAASKTSGASETGPVFQGIADLTRKLAEIDT
jgi:hypothetical protein